MKYNDIFKNKFNKLKVYNSLVKKKEIFTPINYPFVNMYLCGPTVYGNSHIGHARSAIVFDIIFRYLKHLNYKVNYVRNITDIGYLNINFFLKNKNFLNKFNLNGLNLIEISQYYTSIYHKYMKLLNVKIPNIEPRASSNILDQINMIKKIIKLGFAYEVNNSVYFDVKKYNNNYSYGILSGRIIDDFISNNRILYKQCEKKSSLDFALWKNSNKNNLKWLSPWGYGIPGWHIECSAMSHKYLGNKFDIHGGGADLIFPHHECEIAQFQILYNNNPAKYWMHNNMVLINGLKIGKSLGNSINLDQIFQGNYFLLDQEYTPMIIRFFILQTHYRSVINFSLSSLKFSKLCYIKLINGLKFIKNFYYVKDNSAIINQDLVNYIHYECSNCYKSINDDFNTSKLISNLFMLLRQINKFKNGILLSSEIGENSFNLLKNTYIIFLEDILGLKEEFNLSKDILLDILLDLYKRDKFFKNYDNINYIRSRLKTFGIIFQDIKYNLDWFYN